MILITGATGAIGREVVRGIPDGPAVRIMARRPERVTGAGTAAETVPGDFTDPASLTAALRGVSTVFLVTLPDGEDDAGFLRAARSAGVGHVVKLSAAAVGDSRAQDLITRRQRRNEELLRASGMRWTLLRPRSFMSNTLSWAGSIRSQGVVRALYGDSVNACVDPRDVAEVAVRALTGDGHEGRTYTLTGPEAISAAEQTKLLGELLGRQLLFEELGPGRARAALGARYPADIVEALLESAERGRAGSKTAVGGTVAALLGRPARTFGTWAGDHLDAFAGR
ncbi:NAD(P)H-binding protein [Streptomyces sp. NPDC057499]|uniref:NAD(P)H-binding protein n=1 Tax=Streptomyces sp. NPDC057499 TaxID=3346150 RepID=UPI0036D048E3